MAGEYNKETHAIDMPLGDTATIALTIPDGGYDAVIFAVFDPNKTRGGDILSIPMEIISGKAMIRLANRHTRDLKAGEYKWNLRFVTDPLWDAEGNIIIDEDSDNVTSYFGSADKPLPDFILRRCGAYV